MFAPTEHLITQNKCSLVYLYHNYYIPYATRFNLSRTKVLLGFLFVIMPSLVLTRLELTPVKTAQPFFLILTYRRRTFSLIDTAKLAVFAHENRSLKIPVPRLKITEFWGYTDHERGESVGAVTNALRVAQRHSGVGKSWWFFIFLRLLESKNLVVFQRKTELKWCTT